MLKKSLAVGAILWLVAAFAMPAAAATLPSASAPHSSATHVDPLDCDEIGVEGATITVNGVELTAAQYAALGLTNGAMIFAAEASGDSDAEVCIDVAGLPGSPVVNGHVVVCGPVDVDPDIGLDPSAVVLVGGVPVRDGVSTVDTIEALKVADAGGVEACVTSDIVDTRNTMGVAVPDQVCATATLREGLVRTLHLVIGSTSLTLGEISSTELTIQDPLGLLAVDQAVDACIVMAATADFDIHSGTFLIRVVGSSTDGPVTLLPDAAMSSDESPLTTIGLVVVALAVAWAASGRRGRRRA